MRIESTALLLMCACSAFAAERVVDAVKTGDRPAALTLLEQKADVNAPEPDGTTAIDWAVRQNDLDMADRLIRAGADVKTANRYGVTPLSLACINGNAAMVEKLLKAGADPNAAGNEGETPLMTAAHSGSVEAAKVLIEHGANVNARENWHGETALMWAAAQKHPAMLKELIAHGADVNAMSTVIKWERQVTAEPRDKWLPLGGFTPLMFAAREGCVACLPILADAGANLNQADPDGITPMVNAIMNGHYDVARSSIRAPIPISPTKPGAPFSTRPWMRTPCPPPTGRPPMTRITKPPASNWSRPPSPTAATSTSN
jgi:uncharacterized protein